MTQVLVNLLDNAVKYSPPVRPSRSRRHCGAGQLEIEVADRGLGIPDRGPERVFDKFYRVQRRGGCR